jgi:Gpi18-like mannosyltransferase
MNTKKLFQIFVIWRLLLFVLSIIALYLPFKDSFPYRESVLVPYGSPLLYSWGNFDGVHYLGIIQKGYFANFTQAFFPLFPIIVKFFDLFHTPLITGLVLNHIFLFSALVVLVKLIKLEKLTKHTSLILFLILLFPTSFFFVSLYTESLFLLLTVSCFYMMRRQKFLAAVILAAIASATRVTGIFLLPALIFEKLEQEKSLKHQPNWFSYTPFIFSSSGLLLYMYYLKAKFSDPLLFLHAQEAFGASRSTQKLILIYQVIYRYLKMLVTVRFPSLLYYGVFQEFFLSLIFLVLGLFSFKYLRKSYAVYCLLSLIVPTLTGTFSSMPRYILILFPLFFLLTKLPSKVKTLWLVISVILMAINIILFTRGYWVA